VDVYKVGFKSPSDFARCFLEKLRLTKSTTVFIGRIVLDVQNIVKDIQVQVV